MRFECRGCGKDFDELPERCACGSRNLRDRYSGLDGKEMIRILGRFHNDIELATALVKGCEVGFATFYMNRCNRSGVLAGAGPIGGYGQQGTWRMDVRFNRATLAERVLAFARLADSITVSNLDAVEFLRTRLPRGNARSQVFVYLDPPYVIKGQRLYLNAYDERDHSQLASYLLTQKSLHWIMSYDDSTLVRNLYKNRCTLAQMPILYSLQLKREAHELIIAPNRVKLPAEIMLFKPLKKAS